MQLRIVRDGIRVFLTALICMVIAFPPQVMTAFAATDDSPRDSERSALDPERYTGSYSGKTPPLEITGFIDDLEQNRLDTRPIRDADAMHLTDQSIEIFDHGKTRTYDLNVKNVEIPHVAFTGLKLVYDKENRKLMFDAYRGLDPSGEHGLLVARQTIRGIDLAASAQDAELFQFVDSKMRLHVIDFGLVALEILKSPIPIFQKIWEPTEEVARQWTELLASGNVRSGFLTRGTRPMDLSSAFIAPHDQEGRVRLNAGDFYLTYSDPAGGTPDKAIGIFARETTYSQMLRGYQTLQWQAALLSTDTRIQNEVEKIIDQVQGELDRQEINLRNEVMSPQARVVISSLNVGTLKSYENRRESTIKQRANAFDAFNVGEWMDTYSEISRNMPPETSDRVVEMRWYQFINKLNEQTVKAEHISTEAMKNVSEREETHAKLKAIRKAIVSQKGFLTIASVLGAFYFGLPYAIEHVQEVRQIQVISWSYEHFYPTILKDAVYRTPLLLSMASLAAIWPAAVGFSAVVGKTLANMAEKLKGETSRKAIYIKDLAKNWSGLTNWQRITSFGMRLYAWMILPYWRVMIEHIVQQKTFFSAMNNGLNPFQELLRDSDLGKKLGLTDDQRIGLNQIFSFSSKGKSEKIDLNLKMQSALVEENRKLDSIALLVAATLVAEKHKMDPALLMMLGNDSTDRLQLEKISSILDTHEKRVEWQMLSQMVMNEMSGLKKKSLVVDQHLSDLISQYYAAAEKIAKQVDAMPDVRKKVERLRLAFSHQMNDKLLAAANFAIADHEFLRRVTTNDFVSEQVKKEFSIDHMMVVGIVGLYGARADLLSPEHLAADPNGFLWTSRAHWFDIFQNTFIHFFIAGSRLALVYQKIKPRVAENYAPIEDYAFVSRPRQQGLGTAARDWMEVFNPMRSDLGAFIIQSFIKRFTTVTAAITLMVVPRVAIWHQAIDTALLAWGFYFINAQWFFGWVWDPVQRGNQMEGERLKEADRRLKSARQEINRGDLENGRSQLDQLYREYNPKVLGFFDLSKMSKRELLILSVDQPPVFNIANKWLTWVTTWGAAVGSTVLAIPLSVILMDDKLIRAPETWYFWVPISVGLYTAAYLLKKDHILTYATYYEDLKEKWAARIGSKRSGSTASDTDSSSRAGRCEALFVSSAI